MDSLSENNESKQCLKRIISIILSLICTLWEKSQKGSDDKLLLQTCNSWNDNIMTDIFHRVLKLLEWLKT